MPNFRFATLTAIVISSLGCQGSDAAPGGTLTIAAVANPDHLTPPFSRTLAAKTVTDQLFDRLAEVGADLRTVGDSGFSPRLSRGWSWSADSSSVVFRLDPMAKWHDGRPVRATDVRFGFAVYTDPISGANGGDDLRAVVDSISVQDSVTCTAWFKTRSPERFYTLVSNLVPLPEHLLGTVPHDSLRTSAFGRAPVGNGPFKFVRWQNGEALEIAAVDSFYRGRAKLDRVIWMIAPEMGTSVQRLIGGTADLLEALPPDAIAAVIAKPELRTVSYGSFDYGFLRFNTRDGASSKPHPLFGDRALRRALTLALDRPAMVKNVFDSLGRVALGPVARVQWPSDTTLLQLTFDRAAAAASLDSLGWRAGPDGMRSKGGKALTFSVLVPSSSRLRGRYAVLLQEQFRQVGVAMAVEPVDFAAFMARAGGRKFDAMLDGIHTSPSPAGIKQSWASAGIGGGKGPNYGGYSSANFDAQVDSAMASSTLAAAKAHYRAAYQTILDDAPAVWLFEPVAVAGLNRRVTPAVLRPDAWWANLKDWTVRR